MPQNLRLRRLRRRLLVGLEGTGQFSSIQRSNAEAKLQGLHHSGERSELPERSLVSFSVR